MMKFRLIAGKHTQKEIIYKDGKPLYKKDTDGTVLKDNEGKPVPARASRVYTVADGVFESDHDLVTLFNRPGAAKFERLEEGTPVSQQVANQTAQLRGTEPSAPRPPRAAPTNTPEAQAYTTPVTPTIPSDLESLSETDLRKLAESNHIDLSKAKRKDEMVKAIRAWTQS